LPALIGAGQDQLEPGISKPSTGGFVNTQGLEGLQIKPLI
jgi:hypothetical protein